MSPIRKQGLREMLRMAKDSSDEAANILVSKGNKLHVLILAIVASFSIVYTLINVIRGDLLQASINISLLPSTVISYLFFRYGRPNVSKFWNLTHVSLVISLHSLILTPATFILAFFIPIFISTLIVFQGKDKNKGYWATGISVVLFFFLLSTDITIGGGRTLTNIELRTEWMMNLGGVGLVTILEVMFILVLNNSIQNQLLQKSKTLDFNNQQLEASLAARDKMMSIISHDIKGPIIMIHSGLKMIEWGEHLNEEDQTVLKELQKRSESTVSLIDNLLLWSKSQSDKLKFQPIPISMERLNQMIKQLELLIQSKNIGLELNLPAHGELVADKDMLETILRNLLSNAVKFTPPGGKIQLDVIPAQSGFIVSVTDNGTGMTDEIIQKLQQGISYTSLGTSKEKGHGIGLQVVQEFIKAHGSTLEISSQSGHGSRFSFFLKELKSL